MSENIIKSRNPLFHRGEYTDEKGRDFFFDNAKFLLITLVVIGHFIEPMIPHITAAKYIWRVINTLHMPGMIFISGYFSKSYIKNGSINIQRIFSYVILFMSAQILMYLPKIFFKSDDMLSIFEAQSGLWYLQCLIIWCLVLPLIDRLKPSWVFGIAIACGLLIGYDYRAGHLVSLSRAVSHFPFFLAGYYIKKDTLMKVFTARIRTISVFGAIAVLVAFYFLLPFDLNQLPGSKTNYLSLVVLENVPVYLWWCARLFSYICSVILVTAFLSLVPRCWCIFSRFGARTLQVYITHLFIHLANLQLGLWKHLNSLPGMFIMIGIAIVTAVILSFKLFSYPFTLLQSIKIKPFLKNEE